MSDTYILTNNQHGEREEIPCEDIFDGLVAYGRRVKAARDALKISVPTRFGSRYFFVALYDGGRQVSWTIRHMAESGGSWEESRAWKFNAEDEITTITGTH